MCGQAPLQEAFYDPVLKAAEVHRPIINLP